MTTPNTSIDELAVSDVNVELNYGSTVERKFNDPVFRQLTGNTSKTANQSTISLGELSDKTAFGGITGPTSNVVTEYSSANAVIVLTVDTDMVSPNVVWSKTTNSGANATLTANGKSAILHLGSTSGAVTTNTNVQAVLSFDGHTIGSANVNVTLTANVIPSQLAVVNTSSNNSGYVAQTAVATVVATSNVVGGVIEFIVSPTGGTRSANTLTFSTSATAAGVDNNANYSVTTRLLLGNTLVDSNVSTVQARSTFLAPDFTFTIPATTNNNFANSGTTASSIKLLADHVIPSANISWSATKVSGDDATLTVGANNQFANLNISAAQFTFKKSIYDVTANLQFSNGYVLSSKTTRLTLRAGSYGLTIVPAANVQATGFSAQTASVTATASWQAGEFTWNIAKLSGTSANVVVTLGSELNKSGTATITLRANTPGQLLSSQYATLPIITYDNIVIPTSWTSNNTAVTLSAEYQTAQYTIDGPSSNTQIGVSGNVESSALFTANTNIPNAIVTWAVSGNTSSLLMTSNNTNANLYIYSPNNALGGGVTNDTNITLFANYYDEFSRFIGQASKSVALRAYAPALSIAGANSSTVNGYATPQTTSLPIVFSFNQVANSTFNVIPLKLSGDDLTVATIQQQSGRYQTTVTATRSTPGTTAGVYQLTANVAYANAFYSVPFNVSNSVEVLNPNFTLVGVDQTVVDFTNPVYANASFDATFTVPGGTMSWYLETIVGAVDSVPVANNTKYVASTTTNTQIRVTASLYNSNGQFVAAKATTANSFAIPANVALVVSGPSSNAVSNSFTANAVIVLTATSNASLTGETYEFNAAATAGVANVVITADTVTLKVEKGSVGVNSATYSVTTNVRKNGQTLASNTRVVSLSATVSAPTLTLTGTSSSNASFNYPVTANATVTANSTQAGYASWSTTLVSGPAGTINSNTTVLTIQNSQSAVGLTNSVYDVVASFYTPDDVLIDTRSVRVYASAERYNPGFVFASANTHEYGWEENLGATANVTSTVNTSLSGHTFAITYAKVSGLDAGVANSTVTGLGTITITNNRTSDNTSLKESIYDFTCSLIKNAQVIAGPVVRRVRAAIEPYTLTLAASPGTSVTANNAAVITLTATTNHQNASITSCTWTMVKTSGSGNASFAYSTSAPGANNVAVATLFAPPYIGQLTANYNATVNFSANAVLRTANVAIALSANGITNNGGQPPGGDPGDQEQN